MLHTQCPLEDVSWGHATALCFLSQRQLLRPEEETAAYVVTVTLCWVLFGLYITSCPAAESSHYDKYSPSLMTLLGHRTLPDGQHIQVQLHFIKTWSQQPALFPCNWRSEQTLSKKPGSDPKSHVASFSRLSFPPSFSSRFLSFLSLESHPNFTRPLCG